MTLLSLCMICKNEEKMLERCLRSVQGVVDEIIVVDTGSTDKSKEIARKCGATVLDYRWINDFAAARNVGLEKANGKWILFLDADEELHYEDKEKLRKLVLQGETHGYFLKVLNLVGGATREGIDTCPVLRVFRNHKNIRFEGRVHEQIGFSIHKQFKNANIEYTDIRIMHYGYLDEVVKEKNKKERNYTLIKHQVEEEPNNAFHRYNLAGEYIRLEEYEKALEQLRLAKELCPVEQMAFGHLIIKKEVFCLALLDRVEEAFRLCSEEVKRFPDYPDLFYAWGQCALSLNRTQEAKEAFIQVLTIQRPPAYYSMDLGVRTYHAPFYLGQIYEEEGDTETALAYYQLAFANKPDSLAALYRIVRISVQSGDEQLLLNYLQTFSLIDSPSTLSKMIQLLLAFDCYKAATMLFSRFTGKVNMELRWLKDMCHYLGQESLPKKRDGSLFRAVDSWLLDDSSTVKEIRKQTKEAASKPFLCFLEEGTWDEGTKLSQRDLLLIQYGIRRSKEIPNIQKVRQLFDLWRYFVQQKQTDRKAYHAYGAYLCIRAKYLLEAGKNNINKAVWKRVSSSIPVPIVEMDLMQE